MSAHPSRARPARAVAAGFVLAAALSGCAPCAPSAQFAPAHAHALPAPIAMGINVAVGSLAGGETVSVLGTGLEAVDRVTFGGQDSPSVVVVSPTRVDVIVPSSHTFVDGPVPVAIYASAGSAPIVEVRHLEYLYRSRSAVDRQLEYAFAHWNNYTLADYGDFTSWGGDCMNFVSQTLVARGWPVTSDWYNNAQEDWAAAFVDVPSFIDWLDAHPERGATKLTLAQRNQVKVGDLVMFDWNNDGSYDHAQVVSAVHVVDGVTRISMVGHDIDTDFRDVDDALATEGQSGATAFFWSLPA